MRSVNFFDNTTTAAPAAVDPTASNNTTTRPFDDSVTDWVSTVLPVLGVLALIVFLLRLCYKALREDEKDKPRDHYSLQV